MHTHLLVARLQISSPNPAGSATKISPAEPLQCEQLWKSRGWRRWWKRDEWLFVNKTIEPLLRARIKIQDSHRENGLIYCEHFIEAHDLELRSANFEFDPIPTVSVYAYLQLILDKSFASSGNFKDWLEWRISFLLCLRDGNEWQMIADRKNVDFGVLSIRPLT